VKVEPEGRRRKVSGVVHDFLKGGRVTGGPRLLALGGGKGRLTSISPVTVLGRTEGGPYSGSKHVGQGDEGFDFQRGTDGWWEIDSKRR